MENRELDQIQKELDTLHERSQDNKTKIATHEASCEQRYAHLVSVLEHLDEEIEHIHKKINSLNTMATQGSTAFRTTLWLGGVVAGITAFIYSVIQMLPK